MEVRAGLGLCWMELECPPLPPPLPRPLMGVALGYLRLGGGKEGAGGGVESTSCIDLRLL